MGGEVSLGCLVFGTPELWARPSHLPDHDLKVIRREGISGYGEATMAPFTGNAERKMSLLILGAGGHAKVVAETALESGVASSLAFLE